jgi:tetratricopeptide (TPR) repeat protein
VRSSRHRPLLAWAVAAGLVAATLAVYAQVRTHAFVAWDDPVSVYENPNLRLGLGWEGLRWALTANYVGNWIPVTCLSMLADAELHGLAPAGTLLTNVALHATGVLILFAAFLRMTGALGASTAIAAVFALHPLHVESVAWASMRRDVLSGLFFALTLLLHARYAERRSAARYAAVLAATALGLGSKPTLVTLPFLLLLLDLWPLGRLWSEPTRVRRRTRARGREAAHPPTLDRGRLLAAAVEKLPLLALAAGASAMTIRMQGGADAIEKNLPLGVRAANAPLAAVAYVGKAFWPADLAPFYPYPRVVPGAWEVGAAGACLAAMSALAVLAWRRRPYLLVGWLWYLGMLVPVIGLVQVGSQAMADRYTHLPLIGLSLIPIFGLRELALSWRAPRAALPVLACAVGAALGLVSHRQVGHWRDSETLFSHALAVTENNHMITYNLGVLRLREGRTVEGVALLREAVRIQPSWDGALHSLAWTLAMHPGFPGDPAAAAETLAAARRAAARHGNRDPRTLDTLALAQAAAGRLEEAAATAQRALALASAAGDAELAATISTRLDSFRARLADAEAPRGERRSGGPPP